MIIYGRNPVREAIRGPRHVSHVWATRGAAKEPWLEGVRRIVTAVDDPAVIAARCESPDHQGMCAEVSEFVYADAGELLARSAPFLIALDQVQDPQNLGAICRTAECAGADGVVVPERRAATVTPAVCKASAGAVEHLPVAVVRNLADFLGEAKAAGCWCYGADAAGPVAYDRVDLSGDGLVLVLGSEGHGLRPRVARACDALLAVPLAGKVESLSVGATAAILIYAAARARARS